MRFYYTVVLYREFLRTVLGYKQNVFQMRKRVTIRYKIIFAGIFRDTVYRLDDKTLELVCCKKRQKSPNQGTGLGNRKPLETLYDSKLIIND